MVASLPIGCRSNPLTPDMVTARDAEQYRQLVAAAASSVGWTDLSTKRTAIYVHTPEIDRVVAEGSIIVPYLLQKMSEPDIEFDAFVRCYSAAVQIADGEGRPQKIFWIGGASTSRGQLEPGTQTFDAAFRQQVIQSIETCFHTSAATS